MIVQRQLNDTMSVEAGYVGNRGRDVFAGDGPALNINQASLNGYLQGVPLNQRRPFFNRFGWTQGIDYFCNCAKNSYDSLQAKFNKRFSQGYSVKVNYTLQRVRQHGGDHFETDLPEHQGLYNSDLEYGPPDWDRDTQLRVLPRRRDPRRSWANVHVRRLGSHRCAARRLAVQHEHDHPERAAVQRHLQGRGRGSRYRSQPSGSHWRP